MDQQILSKLEQLEEAVSKIANVMVTKNDAKSFATKDDLKNFVTKDDLKKIQEEITEDLTNVIQDFANELHEKKADKTQFAFLHDRITVLEEKITVQT